MKVVNDAVNGGITTMLHVFSVFNFTRNQITTGNFNQGATNRNVMELHLSLIMHAEGINRTDYSNAVEINPIVRITITLQKVNHGVVLRKVAVINRDHEHESDCDFEVRKIGVNPVVFTVSISHYDCVKHRVMALLLKVTDGISTKVD